MSEKTKLKYRYNEESMKAAVSAVKDGKAIRAASKLYGVPRATLFDKVNGRTQIGRKIGRDPYLTREEEISLVRWIDKCGEKGLPPHVEDILNKVKDLVKETERVTPFRDGRPGRYWFQGFKRRNPQILVRKTERVSKTQVGVTEEVIRNWFKSLKDQMEVLGILDMFNDPSRIYNCDIQLCPLSGRVVALNDLNNVYGLAPGPEKSILTFVRNFNARGDVVSPALIYPYFRLPTAAVPNEFLIGVSESGWMVFENFYEYIANDFIPWINEHNITKPVIVFVDGNSTHLTLQVSNLCEDNGVILYILPPNTTNIFQPADVGVFKSLKQYLRTSIQEYQRENLKTVGSREKVAPLLKKVLNQIKPSVISNGFVACGLWPLDPDRVDYTKCLKIENKKEEGITVAVEAVKVDHSTSSTLDLPTHIPLNGKKTNKKRNFLDEQSPEMITGYNYLLVKESKKKKPIKSKSITDDWDCTYCHGTWSEDAKLKNGNKWMICFQCDGRMHHKCIPKKHLHDSGLTGNSSDSEIVFRCEACFDHPIKDLETINLLQN